MIKIQIVKVYSNELTKNLNELLKQLDNTSKPLKAVDTRQIINSPSNRLFAAKVGNNIVGMLTLIIYRIPFAKKGVLEDFVVDENYRGKGIGTKLIKTAISQARREKVKYIDFTSRPERLVANKLYESLGFKKRNTNSYRIIF